MPKTILIVALAVSCSALSGCMSETFQRMDGVTPAAGDAIAANTAMQMVDPWQYGVQDTDLEVPADRGNITADAGAAEASSGGGYGGTSAGSGSSGAGATN